jgi:very-short-patch-repair endonuclease
MTPAERLEREHAKARREVLELAMAQHIRAEKLHEGCVREYRFGDRKFRFDFAWPVQMLALEVDGGTWSGGRHTRGEGFERDCEKQAVAVIAGWRVLRATAQQVRSGEAIGWVKQILAASPFVE